MCNHDDSSQWWLAVLLGLLLLFVVRTTSAQDQPNPDINLNYSESMTNTPQDSASLSEQIQSLQPQWILFKEAFQNFAGSLEQFLDQVEAFGISFEELPAYLMFLTTSLDNYSAAYRTVQEAMIAQLAEETALRTKAETSRNRWRTASFICGVIAIIASGGLALTIIF
jgi:conjugal transfer/entry exclusion protein